MILVTGGTGLVGSHLLVRLIENGNSVRAIYREGSQLKRVEKIFNYYHENGSALFKKIEWKVAELNDIFALENVFESINYVYHAAALISFDPSKFNILLQTNANGTANMVNLCIANKVKKICYVSTIGTIGKSIKGGLATEENEWNDQHVNVYALSKYAAEMEVWRGTQEGLPAVIVNPGVIIGPGFWESGSGALFTTANKGYRFYPPGGTGFVSVHDVVQIMLNLMASDIKNERFIAVAQNLTFKEILQKLTSALEKPSPNKPLKFWHLEIARVVDLLWSLVTKKSRKITKNSIYSMKHRDDYANEKIKEALDFEFEALDPIIDFSCNHFLKENH